MICERHGFSILRLFIMVLKIQFITMQADPPCTLHGTNFVMQFSRPGPHSRNPLLPICVCLRSGFMGMFGYVDSRTARRDRHGRKVEVKS